MPRHPTSLIYLNIILPSTLKYSKWSLSLRSSQQNHLWISCLPIRSTCPAHLILYNLINRIIFDEEYRSWRSLLCRLLHSPVTSSPLGPNILLSTLSQMLSPQCERPCFTPIQNHRQNYISVCLNLYIFGFQKGRQKILHKMLLIFPVEILYFNGRKRSERFT